MKVTRVYADEQGESHFADVDIELTDAGTVGHLSEAWPATSVIFRENDAGYESGWHVAERRQLVVLLDAPIEMEVSDGTRRRFFGGEILLMEDTTGRGHRTRHVEPRQRRSLFITLD